MALLVMWWKATTSPQPVRGCGNPLWLHCTLYTSPYVPLPTLWISSKSCWGFLLWISGLGRGKISILAWTKRSFTFSWLALKIWQRFEEAKVLDLSESLALKWSFSRPHVLVEWREKFWKKVRIKYLGSAQRMRQGRNKSFTTDDVTVCIFRDICQRMT